ncbi:DEAD/DEAH box helicase [Sediminibacillus halophilus]|uniref:Superfamily II DNA or RNA helicase, SNF2 family n=1 Tax=Sediminibacillus halophilus TaxID=482461 RepID=A0A1G9RAJ9_9BACI|nr:DEAD/DEAH box helicase [Sediminibacillus halophilus]SDM20130.1 Superfamily II DNA or RNA helicase, SNF2 family [Sediminibacillus halophilus]
MRTFFLDKQDIVKITGERFYKRGLDYYQKGRVHGITYNPTINAWRGQVRGTETYSVRIFFFDDDDLEGSCDCQAYATHYTCKHIAAVLLAISKESWSKVRTESGQDDFVAEQVDFDFSSRMIDAFTERAPKQKQLLQVEYILQSRVNPHNSTFFLEAEVRLGTSRTYVIKDIRELLSHIKRGVPYKVTPSFTYQPGSHIFRKQDQPVIDQLIDAYDNETLYENSFSNPLADKRSIILPPASAGEMLLLLAETDSYYQVREEKMPIEVEQNVQPVRFQLDKQAEEAFQIDISDLANYMYFQHYGCLFSDGTFYLLDKEQHKIMDQLYALLPYRTDKQQQIAGREMSSFVSNVIPQLEKIGRVHYAEKTKNAITTSPLRPKVYLEEVSDSLQLKLEFHYGEDIVYPYQEDRLSEKVIKREANKELALISLLEKAEFVYLNNMYQLFKTDAIYHFLQETLPQLKEMADVYVSSTVKTLINTSEPVMSSSVEVNRLEGMLDIQFDIDGISAEEVQQLMQALIEKRRYYRIPEGALVSLEDESFDSFRQLADKLQLQKSQVEDGKIQVPMARSFQIEEALDDDHAEYGETFQQLLTQLKNPGNLDFPLPEKLDAELRDYQLTGYRWFKTLSHYHLGGILADDMGLGKTIQTITYLLSEKETNGTMKSLVVAPASLLYNWQKEFEKFAPSLHVAVIAGTKQQRREIINTNSAADVYVTSYPLLRKDTGFYEETVFDHFILDEAQAIKNHLTQTAKATRMIQAGKRFALSGTPIENSLEELWAIFHTISPGLFVNKKAFLNLEHDYIARITRPFILRRLKTDVLEELPDKIETVQYSDLTKQQKQVYLVYLEKMQQQVAETIEEKGFDKGKLEILAGLTRLRQICCHPALFLDNYNGKSGKLEQLLETVRELQESGKRALVFSQFSSMLGIIEQKLTEQGIDVFCLDGSTPSLKRMEMVERFNNGEKTIFLISLKAGGTGLNLTGADTVILYDLWWNPAVEEQAAGRAHRIGQKKVVQVIRLITEGTIEEKIFELQQKKRELVDQIIQPGETMLSKLSEQELRELLQMKV